MKFKKVIPLIAVLWSGVMSAESQEGQPVVAQTVYEVFALNKAEASEMQRNELTDRELYARMMTGLDSGKVVQKKLLAVRSGPGQVSLTESVSQMIRPTEFEAPELPNQIEIPDRLLNKASEDSKLEKVAKGPGWQEGIFPVTPATPAAFKEMMLGDSLETELQIGKGPDSLIHLRYSTSHVGLLGMDLWGQGLSETEVPKVATQRSASSVMVKSGAPICVGTISPGPEEQPKEGDAQVWFAFFTVTLIELKE